MAKTLSDRAQRIVFGGLIVVLVAFGVYLSVDGFGGGGEDDQRDDEDAGGEPGSGGGPATEAPEAIDPSAAEDMEVLDWLPFSEDEFTAAAATAQGFVEAYGTTDYTGSPEEYYAPMEELATDEYADDLEERSGVGAQWQERAEDEVVTEGRADVRSIRSFDNESIIFVVGAQSIPEGDGETPEDLGEFAVTMMKSGGEWGVYDFQPADAGNLGEG